MSTVDLILQKLPLLGVEDTKVVSKAVLDRLEELDEIAAYEAAEANDEGTEPLEDVLKRYPKSPAP